MAHRLADKPFEGQDKTFLLIRSTLLGLWQVPVHITSTRDEWMP